MNRQDWLLKRNDRRMELAKEEPTTKIERDIWNLRWLQTGIEYGAKSYRLGCYATLERAIKALKGSEAK